MESTKQEGGDPFVNYSGENFRLAVPTNQADSSIGANYKIDSDGNVRGSDGLWDRGAFEYGVGGDTGLVSPPNKLRILQM